MDRVTVKIDPRIADRLRLAKVTISATMGQQLTISQSIEYLLEHWAVTRGQRHIITVGPEGELVGEAHAPA